MASALLKTSKPNFAEELVKIFHVCCTPSIPLGVNVKIDEFDEDEEGENWPFREPVGS